MNIIKASLQKELKDAGWHSRGYLPHFDGGEIPQTVNLHLGDSLPKAVIERWRRELEQFGSDIDRILRKRIEQYLDQGYGNCALRDERVARIIQDSLCSLSEILKSMKSFTSRKANELLRRRGRFWMEDYFDRYVRDRKHFKSAIAYIENNPVKAGLCKRPEDWPFSSAHFRARKTLNAGSARTSTSALSA